MTPEEKELTTLAAKAVGHEGRWTLNINREEVFMLNKWRDFSPLTSLADCFFIECQLEIGIYWLEKCVEAVKVKDGYKCQSRKQEPYGTNKQAARMLASTRVAAEIGRQLSN